MLIAVLLARWPSPSGRRFRVPRRRRRLHRDARQPRPDRGLAAAASLLIDYTLTVAVSIAAGVAAVTSAFPAARRQDPLSLAFLIVLTIGNLRASRSRRGCSASRYTPSSRDARRCLDGQRARDDRRVEPVVPVDPLPTSGAGMVSVFILLTAFANGCTALTGVEAVADGVPLFGEPARSRGADTGDDGGARRHDVRAG